MFPEFLLKDALRIIFLLVFPVLVLVYSASETYSQQPYPPHGVFPTQPSGPQTYGSPPQQPFPAQPGGVQQLQPPYPSQPGSIPQAQPPLQAFPSQPGGFQQFGPSQQPGFSPQPGFPQQPGFGGGYPGAPVTGGTWSWPPATSAWPINPGPQETVAPDPSTTAPKPEAPSVNLVPEWVKPPSAASQPR